MKRVRCAESPEIAHQRVEIAIMRDNPIRIHHRQSIAGALQQAPQGPHIRERRDPRRGAAGRFAFGDSQALSQFVKGFAAQESGV